MDKMDEDILGILKKDARESYVNIAQRLGTSEGTIRGRIKRMIPVIMKMSEMGRVKKIVKFP